MSTNKIISLSKMKARKQKIYKHLYTCSQFLRSVDHSIHDDEISLSIVDKQVVLFQDLRIIVKEMKLSNSSSPQNPIANINRFVLQRSITDLSDEYVIVEVSTEEITNNIKRRLDFISRSHPVSIRRDQDLLINVEVRNCHLLSHGYKPSLSVNDSQGWRSISIIMDRLVYVLYSSNRAPYWLRINSHKPFSTVQ